jgi:diguanylate cyclase (GGDEF)-like protein/PAS domain S-box-containing protein
MVDFTAALFERALEHSATASVIVEIADSGSQGLYANASFQELTGFSAREITNGGLELLHGKQTDPDSIARLRTATQTAQELHLVLRSYRRDGRPFWNRLQILPLQDATGRATHYLAMLRDVTAEHIHAERLEYRAHHDPVTGLPNRHLLGHRLEEALTLAGQAGRPFALIFIDVDRFKLINDTFGHHAGDRVLQSVGERLMNCVRADDTVARYGGDEFVLLLHEGPECVDTEVVRKRLVHALTQPIVIDNIHVDISCSIGMSVYPTDGGDVPSLCKHADADMYNNKPRDGTLLPVGRPCQSRDTHKS